MALPKRLISIPFQVGIDTKIDEKQENIGYLRRLENAIFDTLKKLRKRNGYELIITKDINNNSILNAKTLTKFRDELGLMTDNQYYSRSEAIDKWTNKGKIFSAFPTSSPVTRDDYSKSNVDLVSSDNLNAFTYEDSRGIRLTIKDNQSGNFILSDASISATGTKPRITNIQNTLFIFYIDGTDIKYKTVNLIAPTTISSESTAVSDLNATDKIYDVAAAANKNIISYNNTGAVLSVLSVDLIGNISSIVTVAGETPSKAIDVYTDANDRILITYSNGTEVKINIRALTITGEILAATVIETISDAVNVTTIQRPDSSDYITFYEIEAASAKDTYVKSNTVDVAGTVGTASVLIRSVGLASKAFSTNSKYYVTTVHQSTLQSTYFVVESDGCIISKISPSIGGGLTTMLPKVSLLEENKFVIGSLIKGKTVTDDGTFFSVLGINSTELNFNISDPYQNDELGDNLHITGGTLKMYDGNVVVEHGFQLFPEDKVDGGTATTGGSMEDGTYQYSAVYAWTDNYGQIHRSAPSIPISIALSGGTATQTQTVTVPSLRLTDKENVIIELYRTEAGGTIFYKVTSTTNPTFNDPTVNTVDVTDTVSDTDLIDNEILYTTGGFLDNIPAPSSQIIEAHNDRIFLAGLEDRDKIVFSKTRDENQPVEFNDTLYKYVSNVGGSITAMQTMDDKLIIFKQDAIFYISGDGPNNLGEQDTFIEPEQVSSEVGAIDGKSVVLTPLGTMFKSRKGIYLLDRGLSLQYIGAAVEDFNDLTVTSAAVISDKNQVRFTTREGECLVYDFYVQQWTTFGNHRGVSAVVLNEDYFYLRPDAVLYKEDDDKFNDHGSSIDLSLETGWISFAQVQGFQRVYKFYLLSKFKSKHKLRIRVAYNFNEAFTQEKIIDTADFTDDTAYGEDSPYGNPITKAYGGDGNVHQIRLDLKTQKCQSIKIRIEEIQDQEIGEGLSISNMLFEVGVKGQRLAVDRSNTYGTSKGE